MVLGFLERESDLEVGRRVLWRVCGVGGVEGVGGAVVANFRMDLCLFIIGSGFFSDCIENWLIGFGNFSSCYWGRDGED